MNRGKGKNLLSVLKLLLPICLLLLLNACITYYHTVTIDHPERERLKIEKYKTILVAGFAAERKVKEIKFDLGKEAARYFRQALRSHSKLKLVVQEPLELTPKKVDEIVANPDYLRRLSLRAGADLILLGKIDYKSKPFTAFEEVVYRHPVSKRLIKGTRVVNKKRHQLELTLYLIDGVKGEPIYQDTLKQEITYREPSPPKSEAYFHLLNRVIAKFLEIITPYSSKALRNIIV